MGILVSSAAQVATDEADPKVLSKGVSRLHQDLKPYIIESEAS